MMQFLRRKKVDYPEPHRNPGGKTYYFHAYVKGKRKHLSTGKKVKREAYQYIREFFEKNISHEFSEETFKEYSDIFYHWDTCPRVARRLNEGKPMGELHVAQCRRNLDKYVMTDPIFPLLTMRKIKRRDLLDLRERLKPILGDKVNTLNKTMNAVKTVFSEAYFREDIQTDPGSKIGALKEDRVARDILSENELRVLFQDPPGYWDDQLGFDFFFTLANTGMRGAELRALKWDMWDRENKIIKVHRAWKGNKAETLGLPKWDKVRDIPVSDTVAETLESQNKENEFLFCGNAHHLSYTWLFKRMKGSIARSGLDLGDRKITSHCLRHSVNTLLLSKGVNPISIQAYLGWSKDSALTRVQEGYTHFTPDHIREIPAILEDIWKL
jgi:integrase